MSTQLLRHGNACRKEESSVGVSEAGTRCQRFLIFKFLPQIFDFQIFDLEPETYPFLKIFLSVLTSVNSMLYLVHVQNPTS